MHIQCDPGALPLVAQYFVVTVAQPFGVSLGACMAAANRWDSSLAASVGGGGPVVSAPGSRHPDARECVSSSARSPRHCARHRPRSSACLWHPSSLTPPSLTSLVAHGSCLG